MSRNVPEDLWEGLEPLLSRVERPSRYIGGEWNSPEPEGDRISVVFAYPDIYEVGTSNLGLAILQEIVNEIEGATAERTYSPWVDMESEMRAEGLPLFSLESHRPVSSFDILGITIPHELTYTNILNLLDLAGLPLRASERNGGPVVIGGGCGTANPEPLAPLFDLFALGDGEEAIISLVELFKKARDLSMDREDLLREASRLPGIYRPSDYEVRYGDYGTVASITPVGDAAEKILKNVVDLDKWRYPLAPVVSHCEAVHDRINVELFRGCTQGCRFCQAGMINRPVRERLPKHIISMVETLADSTGSEEVSLSSLSSTDYSCIEEVAEKVAGICGERNMVMSLPSLRVDGMSAELAGRLDKGGRGSLTFAPEAATESLRKAINKNVTERNMEDAVLNAVKAGRRRIKLYFMIGLPTETDADVEEIAELVFRLRSHVKREGYAPPSFNISVASFIPKSHTPFQWCAQAGDEEIRRKQEILKRRLRTRNINLSWHDREMSKVEGFLSRADRRVFEVLVNAWSDGGRFDSWSEHFDLSRWERAWDAAGVDPAFYLYRERPADEVFPWDHLDHGVEKYFLRTEYKKAFAGEKTPDCRGIRACMKCGACDPAGRHVELKGHWRF